MKNEEEEQCVTSAGVHAKMEENASCVGRKKRSKVERTIRSGHQMCREG